MSFPGKLLTISMKKQITWTITICSIISILLIYFIINLYTYEIYEQSVKNHREYFYTIQKDILQNIINFQNFFLFNYEDTLKNLMCQLVILFETSKLFLVEDDSKSVYTYNFEKFNYTNISHAVSINQSLPEDIIYFMFENDSYIIDDATEVFIKMSSRIISIFKTFRIPYYGDKQLFDGMAIYLNKTKEIYSMNNAFFYNFINNEIGGENYNEFYLNLTKVMVEAYANSTTKILEDDSLYPELTLDQELYEFLKQYKNSNIEDIKILAKYTPYIDYSKELIHLIRIEDVNNELFMSAKLKTGLIDDLFLKMMEFFNLTTLIMLPDNNYVLNLKSCQALLIKLEFYFNLQEKKINFDKFRQQIEKNKNKFIDKKVSIDKCLLDNENIQAQRYTNDYISQNQAYYFDIVGGYNSSFIKMSNASIGSQYMVTRYTYPDYFLMERKKPRYLIPFFMNVYSFFNFYVPFTFVKQKTEYLLLNIYFITLGSWHLWIILFAIIMLIGLKLSRDITDPLIKLKKAIEQMSFNDDKIFEYKDDDIINDLFIMCKELFNSDELKKSKKINIFNEYKFLKDKGNKKAEVLDKNSGINQRGNRNLILNNQLFEKNKRISIIETKNVFNREIIIYKDNKYLVKSRPRNQTRKRPKVYNIEKEFDIEAPLKTFNRYHTKGDYHVKSNIRDNFMRDSSGEISFNEAEVLAKKSNKNVNEINILSYELLFYLGKKMFRSQRGSLNKYYKMDKSTIPNNSLNNWHDSSKNAKYNLYEDTSNKYYNYDEQIFENNNIYEERKNNQDQDYDKKKALKDEYLIDFHKNSLYYKYLKEKKNPMNNFMYKIKKINDLEMDNDTIIQIDDEDEFPSILKKTMKRNENALSRLDRKNKFLKINESIRGSLKLKSINARKNIKNYNFEVTKERHTSSRNSVTTRNIIYEKLRNNQESKKVGVRASIKFFTQRSVSAGLEKDKKIKFNSKIKKYK